MNELTKKVLDRFYQESLTSEIYSEEFNKNSKQISKMFREKFGMNKTWMDYHESLLKDKNKTLSLLEVMYKELIKL